jgi:hypothetical protein
MNRLALHAIARGRDGLRAPLLDILRRRALLAADPKIVPLRAFDPSRPEVAGAPPAARRDVPQEAQTTASAR